MRVLFFLRSTLYVLIFFPILTIIFTVIGVLGFLIFKNRTVMEWCGYRWSWITLKALNVRVHVKGKNNIPHKGQGCLFLFNHSSFMDIFSLTSVVRKIKFGTKIELFYIPIFGLAIRVAGMVPIARSHREKAIHVLEEAQERARRGERFALSPEGGRNAGRGLLPFKSGPFIFAIQSQVPIIPVIIRGAGDAWPKHTLIPCTQKWRYDILLEFLPAISVEGLTTDQRKELASKTREIMLRHMPA